MYGIERDPLLGDDAPATLARRVERVITTLQRHEGVRCASCQAEACSHQVLLCLVLGHQDRPLCAACLARTTGRQGDLEAFLAQLGAYVQSKECLRTGWSWATMRERDGAFSCPFAVASPSPGGQPPIDAANDRTAATPAADATWDAGQLGCGDLVLELRTRLRALRHGQVLELMAHDPAAPVDLPAWCRLTGHALVAARHPRYWIRRKEE